MTTSARSIVSSADIADALLPAVQKRFTAVVEEYAASHRLAPDGTATEPKRDALDAARRGLAACYGLHVLCGEVEAQVYIERNYVGVYEDEHGNLYTYHTFEALVSWGSYGSRPPAVAAHMVTALVEASFLASLAATALGAGCYELQATAEELAEARRRAAAQAKVDALISIVGDGVVGMRVGSKRSFGLPAGLPRPDGNGFTYQRRGMHFEAICGEDHLRVRRVAAPASTEVQ